MTYNNNLWFHFHIIYDEQKANKAIMRKMTIYVYECVFEKKKLFVFIEKIQWILTIHRYDIGPCYKLLDDNDIVKSYNNSKLWVILDD